jgi:pyruvate dehydrogenase E1 component alpha subunit
MGTALHRAQSQLDLSLKATSYQIPAWPVDGMDVLEVERAARKAVALVRDGGGPCFLELRTYRFRAHSMFDPQLYRDKAEVEEWKRRDPISGLSGALQAAGMLSAAELEALETEVALEIANAVTFAEAGHWEPAADLLRFVYREEGLA